MPGKLEQNVHGGAGHGRGVGTRTPLARRGRRSGGGGYPEDNRMEDQGTCEAAAAARARHGTAPHVSGHHAEAPRGKEALEAPAASPRKRRRGPPAGAMARVRDAAISNDADRGGGGETSVARTLGIRCGRISFTVRPLGNLDHRILFSRPGISQDAVKAKRVALASAAVTPPVRSAVPTFHLASRAEAIANPHPVR